MRQLATRQLRNARNMAKLHRIDSYSETTLGMCTSCWVTAIVMVILSLFGHFEIPFPWESGLNTTSTTTITTTGGPTTTSTTQKPRPPAIPVYREQIDPEYMKIPAIVTGTTSIYMYFGTGSGDALIKDRAVALGIPKEEAGVQHWEAELRKNIMPYSLQDQFEQNRSDFRVVSITEDVGLGEHGRVLRVTKVIWKVDVKHGGDFLIRANHTGPSGLAHVLNRTMSEQAFFSSIDELNIRTKVHVEFYGMMALRTHYGNTMSVSADGQTVRGMFGMHRAATSTTTTTPATVL